MHHTLADEQIGNANRYLKMVSGASLSAAEMNQLATHLQIAPPQLSGDVVEAIVKVYMNVTGFSDLSSDDMRRRASGLTAAAQVLLEFEEVYAHKVQDLNAAKFIRRFRNSLLKPAEPTMEEMESMLPFWIECWEGRIRDGKLTFDAEEAESIIKDYRNLNKALITRHTGASHDR